MRKELNDLTDGIFSGSKEDISKMFWLLFNDKEKRLAMVRRSTFLFAFYYFNFLFKNKIAAFHKEMCYALDDDYINNVLMIMFRGSGKTTYIKADFLRNICFGLRKVMIWGSADGSTNNLFDIARQLQINPMILQDFGPLYFPDKSQERFRSSKKTAVGDFQTANGVRVFSTGIGGSLRGIQNFEEGMRIDYLVLDDIENDKTIRRRSVITATKSFIDEALGAFAPDYKFIILGNRISLDGVIAYLEEKFKDNKKSKVIEKAVIEKGKPVWPGRFVLTDKEKGDRKDVYSIEEEKRKMNSGGKKRFEQEYMNIPLVNGNLFFDDETDLINEVINDRKENQIVRKIGKWTIFKPLEKIKGEGVCGYLLGIDVAAGYGGDSSVIQVLNLDTSEQVAEYCNNFATPNELINEIIWAHEKYNKAKIIPERNSLGLAVVEGLKDKGYGAYMTKQKTIDNIKNKVIEKYGWVTTSSSKPKMLFDFKKDFAEGNIIINSIPLLNEMKRYTNDGIDAPPDTDPESSNHFDRLMAICIANANKRTGVGFYVQKKNYLE